jgi:actin-related protein 3
MPGYSVKYPIRHGIVDNWDLMEKYWEQCIFKYLKCESIFNHPRTPKLCTFLPNGKKFLCDIPYSIFKKNVYTTYYSFFN